jgi:hypothetical protein
MRLTPQAIDLVRRSLAQAKLDPATAGVRLREVGGELRPRFVEGPEAGDHVIEADGLRIFIHPQLAERAPDAVVGVSQEHEQLVLLGG